MVEPILFAALALACVVLALVAARKPVVGPTRPQRDVFLEDPNEDPTNKSRWRGMVCMGTGWVPDVIVLGEIVDAQEARIAALEARLAAIEQRTGQAP
jgi:heme A synthase